MSDDDTTDGGEDLPDEPEPIEFTTERGATVTVTADVNYVRGALLVTVNSNALEFTNARARLGHRRGMDVINCGRQTTAGGETIEALIPVGEHKAAIERAIEASEARHEAKKESERAKPLIFEVVEHSYRVSDYPTSDLALRASKTYVHLTDDERALIDEASDLAGTVGLGDGGDPKAFGGMKAGDEVTADELRTKLDEEFGDEQDEREAKREREEARAALVETHPELSGLSFDADDAREAFAEAAETGERAVVATGGSECNDPDRECSWDRITAHATPDGDVERERIHTY